MNKFNGSFNEGLRKINPLLSLHTVSFGTKKPKKELIIKDNTKVHRVQDKILMKNENINNVVNDKISEIFEPVKEENTNSTISNDTKNLRMSSIRRRLPKKILTIEIEDKINDLKVIYE
jgi:uncharacterized membrane protein YgaE (UPF0421/DUF939 family)